MPQARVASPLACVTMREVFFFIIADEKNFNTKDCIFTLLIGILSQINFVVNYLFLIAACAAARRAIGTRYGEQETYVSPALWKKSID